MAKRVLVFSLNYYPFVGGAEVALKEITDRISSEEIEFHLICYRFDQSQPKKERIGNCTVHRVGRGKRGMTAEETFKPVVYLGKIFYVPFAALKAYRLNRANRFDGAFALMSYMVFPLVMLRLVGVRIPYLLNLQDGDPFERVFDRWFIKPFKPLLLYGFKKASVVQVLSTYLAKWAREMEYKGPIEVVPNGADTERFLTAAPLDFGRIEGEIWLVTSSRLVHKNAVDDVIRALALLPENIKFLILGTGPDEPVLRDLVRELSLKQRVVFQGHVSHDVLPGYIKSADIFIRPSRTEGFGASFPEAMAAGIPVIATQEGGIADFLFDAKRNPEVRATGWAVDPDAPEQIAEAVQDILTHPETVQKVVETARRMVLEKYDWNSIAAQTEAVLKKYVVTQI